MSEKRRIKVMYTFTRAYARIKTGFYYNIQERTSKGKKGKQSHKTSTNVRLCTS